MGAAAPTLCTPMFIPQSVKTIFILYDRLHAMLTGSLQDCFLGIVYTLKQYAQTNLAMTEHLLPFTWPVSLL